MADNQLNYMIVDGVLRDYVEEISEYIDKLDGDENQTFAQQSIQKMESEDEAALAELFTSLAQKSAVLSKAPETEFEPAWNLLLHILTFAPHLTELLPTVTKNLVDNVPDVSSGAHLVLSVLANLFNILPATSPLRYDVFETIVEFAAKTGNVHLLSTQFKNLPQWLKEWGVGPNQQSEIYGKIGDILSSSSNDDKAYTYLFEASKHVNATEIASRLVSIALASEDVYDFDDLLALESVQALRSSNSALFDVLDKVSVGDFKGYESLSVPPGVDAEAVNRKVKVLALSQACYKSGERNISYADIAKGIDVPETEVELWVIDAVRAGLVEGRLSQMDRMLDVHRATPIGSFGMEEWKQVEKRLEDWKTSLKDVLDVLNSARDTAGRRAQPVN
jgi:translation initiation factor 3 subunit M